MNSSRGVMWWQGVVITVVVLLVLLMVNKSIWQKEQHLAQGQEVLLAMIPVDPRSLMQGDYMRVRFAIETDIKKRFGDTLVADGMAMLRIDEHNIGHFESIAHMDAPVVGNQSDNLVPMRFRIRNGQVKLATGSFFFQEGKGAYYEKAKYGVFKVNDKGEVLLTDLALGPEQ